MTTAFPFDSILLVSKNPSGNCVNSYCFDLSFCVVSPTKRYSMNVSYCSRTHAKRRLALLRQQSAKCYWREQPQEQSKLHIWAVCRSQDILLCERCGAFSLKRWRKLMFTFCWSGERIPDCLIRFSRRFFSVSSLITGFPPPHIVFQFGFSPLTQFNCGRQRQFQHLCNFPDSVPIMIA